MPLTLVSRKEWGAKDAVSLESFEEIPVPYVILKYYTRSESCRNLKECTKVVQQLQHHHMEELYYIDIKYNFLIGGDGTVFEGRGWTTIHTTQDLRFLDFFCNSIAIAYIGDFQHAEPPVAMVRAANDLIKYGISGNFIRRDYELIENKKDTIMPYDPGSEEAYRSDRLYQYAPF